MVTRRSIGSSSLFGGGSPFSLDPDELEEVETLTGANVIDRTNPTRRDEPRDREGVARSTERPVERASTPRRPPPAPEVDRPSAPSGGIPTPSRPIEPSPVSLGGGDGTPSVFSPLPSPPLRALAQTDGGVPTPGIGTLPRPQPRMRPPQTFGTVPGSPVVGRSGGLIGGGLDIGGDLDGGGEEADITALLEAILAMSGGQ